MKTMKGKQDWKIPSYLKDDDDDQSSDDDPSQFLKTTSKPSSSNESKKIGSKSTSPPPKLIKSPRVKDDDPLLSLFNDNLHGELPRTTIDFARGKSDLEYKSSSPPRLTSPNRVRSPTSQITKEDRITSPRSYT
uniref:Uncharacterized protein n=1 Tax=Ciona savignyi TaxID=51511 RepID=H2ZL46_CIOSA